MSNAPCLLRLTVLACLILSGSVQAVTCDDEIPPGNPDNVYTPDRANGTVTDTRTGLMWKACAEGQSWNGSACYGTATGHTWAEALELAEESVFADYDDWRLPSIKELMSLVETCRYNPAINHTVFPSTLSSEFWSSSPYTNNSQEAWYVRFSAGQAQIEYRGYDNNVRLVRGGPSLELFNLTVSKTGTGRGTVTSAPEGINCGTTCSADFADGTSITLTAEPASGSTFGGWSGCTPNPQNDAQCTLTLTADTTVDATFSATTANSDFVITDIRLTPTSPAADSLFSAQVTVSNQGSLSGDGGYLDLWTQITTAPRCGDSGHAWAAVGTLAAGESKTLTLDNLRAGRRAGSQTLGVFVDSWCETSESNESNNKRSKTYTVQ